MHDITSILFAARELCESLKSEKNKDEENKEYSSCLIGKEIFYFPKKKVFEEKKDIVPNLF